MNKKNDRYASDTHRQKRGKNIAVALAILGFVLIVYMVSIVKIGGLTG